MRCREDRGLRRGQLASAIALNDANERSKELADEVDMLEGQLRQADTVANQAHELAGEDAQGLTVLRARLLRVLLNEMTKEDLLNELLVDRPIMKVKNSIK